MASSSAATYVVEGKFLGTCSATDADDAAASKGVNPAADRVAAAVSDAVAADDGVNFASAPAEYVATVSDDSASGLSAVLSQDCISKRSERVCSKRPKMLKV